MIGWALGGNRRLHLHEGQTPHRSRFAARKDSTAEERAAHMCTIAESNVLLRAQAELPASFKVATDEFREGWNRMRAGGKPRLVKKVQTRGWNFVKTADGAQRSGVGETSQAAIAS